MKIFILFFTKGLTLKWAVGSQMRQKMKGTYRKKQSKMFAITDKDFYCLFIQTWWGGGGFPLNAFGLLAISYAISSHGIRRTTILVAAFMFHYFSIR